MLLRITRLGLFVVGCINKVNRRLAQLVLGWQLNFLGTVCNHPPRSTQPGHLTVGRHNEYQQKLGRKQAHHAMHWPRIHGLAM